MLNSAFLQICIDLALLAAVVVLLWRVNANLKKPLLMAHQEMMKEIKEIMAESQASSENFLQKLEQSRLALKEIALELEIKEQRVKALLAKYAGGQNEVEGRRFSVDPSDKYAQVIDMIRRGCSEAETAEAAGLTEAEVGLIVDLYRVKNEHI